MLNKKDLLVAKADLKNDLSRRETCAMKAMAEDVSVTYEVAAKVAKEFEFMDHHIDACFENLIKKFDAQTEEK